MSAVIWSRPNSWLQFQSLRALESSRDCGHESAIAWRKSPLYEISKLGMCFLMDSVSSLGVKLQRSDETKEEQRREESVQISQLQPPSALYLMAARL